MTNSIARAREQQVFCVAEATRGVLQKPIAAALVVAVGFAKMDQQPSHTESDEIVNSRDVLDRFQDRTPPGSFSLQAMVRPSGSLGVEPMGSILFESLLGAKTIDAGASVTYSPAMEKPSFSMWVLKSHTLFFARGVTVGSGKCGLTTKGGMTFDFSGAFMEMGWVGTDEIGAIASSAATTVEVADIKKFRTGGLVEFVHDGTTYNNTDGGYQITAINSGASTITITPGLEGALVVDDIIQPWLPTGTIIGDPIENRTGRANVAGTVIPITNMDISVADDAKYMEDEISQSDFPEEYVEDKRTITGSLDVLMRRDDLGYFQEGYDTNEVVVSLLAGNEAGSNFEIKTPRTSISVPTVEEQSPTVELKMTLQALGTNGEDSVEFIFT